MSIGYILRSPIRWMRSLYDWTLKWSKTDQAPRALFLIAFAESSFFPIPPDVLLIPMVVADVKRWWKNALICTVGSLLGAVLGYYIGFALFETVGKWIVETYDLQEAMNSLAVSYSNNAFLAVFTAAFTPIPYKIITISAGLFKVPLVAVLLASAVGRAGRFFAVAGLLKLFGKKIADSVEKYFDIISILFLVLLIGGFYVVKYAF